MVSPPSPLHLEGSRNFGIDSKEGGAGKNSVKGGN